MVIVYWRFVASALLISWQLVSISITHELLGAYEIVIL